ncbi:hypothetical protein ACH4F6_38085 [Streptomyces sp. NPDC017936]|uniref:hypothetical protein n=1 Tax=Streptomyces sp. NPDC017936 TaxID=3365016 RepID=UPI003793A8A2
MPETPADQPSPVTFHWIMTARTSDGREGTNDGRIDATPGIHTHHSTYSAVRKAMAEWLGTEDFIVLFFSATPDRI